MKVTDLKIKMKKTIKSNIPEKNKNRGNKKYYFQI